VTETCEITLRVTADPEEFRGGDGHPSTPLVERVRAELTAALEELGATVEIVASVERGD
jgi:hypothetical protein